VRGRLRFGWGVAAAVLALAAGAWPACAKEPKGLDSVVRSASLFTAMTSQCAKLNIDRARDYLEAFVDIATQMVGIDKFKEVMELEMKRRNAEVKSAGSAKWCAYQRTDLQKLGIEDIFQ
jgi:hypothetical protein